MLHPLSTIKNGGFMKFYHFIAGILALLPTFSQAAITPEEAEAIATDVYIYAYPLVTMDATKNVMTNVMEPTGNKAPVGQFANAKTYPNASFTDITAPNADTLYSTAWLDVGKEPYILHVPNEEGRYYLMPMLSAWTDVFASPGTRTTGTEAQDFAITGPNWTGQLPEGMKEFKSPTNLVWILGRTYCTGTPEDYTKVHDIQKQYSITPLSSYRKPYTPPQGVINPAIDMKTAVREQVNKMDAATYFKRFSELLTNNPTSPNDTDLIAKMQKIGIQLGQTYDLSKVDPSLIKSIENAPKLGIEKIIAHSKTSGTQVNGWLVTDKTGAYGTDYLQRAAVTFIGLGANLPQDAVYPFTNVDSNGQPLKGSNHYVIHFAKDETPPVNGFWSLTLYNDKFFFFNNPLNRYTLSPRNSLKYNEDGSLDLYIQNESPDKDKESNWLPAPADDFVLMLRFYWPKASLLDGKWTLPLVKKTN